MFEGMTRQARRVPQFRHPSSGSIRNPPAWHRGLRALRARNPKRVRKESERVSRASGPGTPQSPQRVRHAVRKESKKSPKLRFWTLFGLRGALFGDSGAPRGRRPRDTLSDSFRTLSGPEGPVSPLCQAGGVPNGSILALRWGNVAFLEGFPIF